MPGVPSSHGCAACRKQKKRCDLAVPACSRCTRLNILCTGRGQRYKFTVPILAVNHKAAKHQQPGIQHQALLRIPQDDSARLRDQLVYQFDTTDLRFDVGVYGQFLREIPSRLGFNEALDASALAFADLWSSLHEEKVSSRALKSYGKSLTSLRACLRDTAIAKTPETLCAMALIWICEGWLTSHDNWSVGHGAGINWIMSQLDLQNDLGVFEVEILLSLSSCVLLEAMFNSRIEVGEWIWTLLDNYLPQTPGNAATLPEGDEEPSQYSIAMPSLSLRSIATCTLFARDPKSHVEQATCVYAMMQKDRKRIKRWHCLWGLDDSEVLQRLVSKDLDVRLTVQCRHSLSLILCLALIINRILQEFTVDADQLIAEMNEFEDELINLAMRAGKLRPIGAQHVPLVLMSAWAASNDQSRQERAEVVMAEHFFDDDLQKYLKGCRWLKTAIHESCMRVTCPPSVPARDDK